MIRRIDRKAVLTLVVLLAVFVVALVRSKYGQLSLWLDAWKGITLKSAPSNPEDGIYAMFDAARAGDPEAYLDCFSGPLRDQIAATAKEDSAEKFKAYLRSQNAAVEGMAVSVTDRPTAEEARIRVEYVYRNHNEVQNVRMKREGARWKIVAIDGAEAIQPLVPYGTKATD